MIRRFCPKCQSIISQQDLWIKLQILMKFEIIRHRSMPPEACTESVCRCSVVGKVTVREVSDQKVITWKCWGDLSCQNLSTFANLVHHVSSYPPCQQARVANSTTTHKFANIDHKVECCSNASLCCLFWFTINSSYTYPWSNVISNVLQTKT